MSSIDNLNSFSFQEEADIPNQNLRVPSQRDVVNQMQEFARCHGGVFVYEPNQRPKLKPNKDEPKNSFHPLPIYLTNSIKTAATAVKLFKQSENDFEETDSISSDFWEIEELEEIRSPTPRSSPEFEETPEENETNSVNRSPVFQSSSRFEEIG